MDTLDSAQVGGVLTRLFDEATTADGALMTQIADEWGAVATGYRSVPLPFEPGPGNEPSVRAA